jgi:hypothetical protein
VSEKMVSISSTAFAGGVPGACLEGGEEPAAQQKLPEVPIVIAIANARGKINDEYSPGVRTAQTMRATPSIRMKFRQLAARLSGG